MPAMRLNDGPDVAGAAQVCLRRRSLAWDPQVKKALEQVLSLRAQQPARLAFLVARFRRTVEQQRARDAELVAGLERVARDPRVRRIIREIQEIAPSP
jgi:hypothetical protein